MRETEKLQGNVTINESILSPFATQSMKKIADQKEVNKSSDNFVKMRIHASSPNLKFRNSSSMSKTQTNGWIRKQPKQMQMRNTNESIP